MQIDKMIIHKILLYEFHLGYAIENTYKAKGSTTAKFRNDDFDLKYKTRIRRPHSFDLKVIKEAIETNLSIPICSLVDKICPPKVFIFYLFLFSSVMDLQK